MNGNGLVKVRSQLSANQTLERLRAAIAALGMAIFAEVDHSGAAAKVQMPLRPTMLLEFGNPRGGTPLMQENQEAGIDLPLKALVWEDVGGVVWLGYDDPQWIARRHHLGEASLHAIEAMVAAMAALAQRATTA
jgi:uncharacterized protein (DUF302 family)